MKLFMFYVGGDCGNSNIELHDIRFSVGETAEACFDDLRRQWWGDPKSLHLDCWGAVEQADGFDIILTDDASETTTDKLFFVNLGGYDPADFAELHKNVLVVAPDIKLAKQKALTQVGHWEKPHKDRLFEIEKALDVSALMERYDRRLMLRPAEAEKPFVFTCDYRPIAL
jgi:uncharacterized protein DUF1543